MSARHFYDLLELFRVGGQPPNVNYLFLGGVVNLGYFSVETISLLACLLLRYPNRIHLIRGSHESRVVTEVYGFYGECMRKYGTSHVWRYFTDMFDHLPLCASIENRVFCVHGGLSPSLMSVDHIRLLNRFKEVPIEGPMTDLLWSDPTTATDETGFSPNPQGAGFLFGSDAVEKFTRSNNIDLILRSHQLCLDGYQTIFSNKLPTIWSAPNFCHRAGNAACIVEIQENFSVFYNTYLSAPESERIIPTPDVVKAVPDYFE